MTMIKKSLLACVLVFVCVLLWSCEDSFPADTSGEVSELNAPEFSSRREALRELSLLLDSDVPKSIYTELWQQTYREISGEITALIADPPENDGECIQHCRELYSKLSNHKKSGEYARSDVAAVHIFAKTEIGREEYIPAKIYIIDKEGGTFGDLISDITIRVRGNSTAASDKKPYNIKFELPTSVLGMPEGRKWCLIANHFDKTLIRNKLAFYVSEMTGSENAIKSEFCDVYLEGRFMGSYLLTQPVSDGVIGLNTKDDDFLVERIVVLEGENDFFLRGDAGYVFDSPAAGEMNRNRAQEIINFMTLVDSAMAERNEKNLKALIDVNSFVSAYITHELLKDCDIVTGSTYFYRKDGVLFAGPIWDMDLSTGNVSHEYYQDKYHIYNNADGFGDKSGDSASGIWAQQEWFASLMQCDFFVSAVKERYEALQPQIKNLYAENGYIDTLCETHSASFARNYDEAGWRIDTPYCDYETDFPKSTYGANVKELKDWIMRRNNYLTSYFEDLD